MHAPDGIDYPVAKTFVEVVAPERIVLRHDQETHGFLMTITLAEEAGKTRLTWRMAFDSPDEGERVREFIAIANEQNFDRLEAVLAE